MELRRRSGRQQDGPESSLSERSTAAQPRPGQVERALEFVDYGWALFDAGERLVFCNAAYRTLLGLGAADGVIGQSRAELLERWLDDLQFSGEEQRANFKAERLLQRGAPRSDFDVFTRGGRCLRVTDRRTPEGVATTTIVDRTDEEHSTADQRRELAISEAASAAKSELFYSMSYELRTPLNAVLGFAQLMQRDRKEPLTQRHRPRVAQILKGGEHLVRIMDDLLVLSRIEAGRLSVSLEAVNVEDALEQVRATLHPMAMASGVHLRLAVPADAPQIAADRGRFHQILMNFGSNAIKYNRANGSVIFGASIPRASYLRICVADTGIGIPDDQRHSLFEPFQRAGQERGNIEGTGMGLAISKRLAELMHGEVGFSSTWRQGSEFWVDLPLHASFAAAASA
jgi:signal transduction histidine kinase